MTAPPPIACALVTVEVRTERDVVLARQRARQIASLLGFDLQSQTKLGTAVSEIVRNAFRYAGSGKVVFEFEQTDHRRLIITVTDTGPGIANLEDILDGRYQSQTGMGKGLTGTQRIMDQFEITSAPACGTRVRMAKFLSPRAPAITRENIASIAAILAKGIPGDPVGEVQTQNQELLRVLEELQLRQQELALANRELDDTNRGVVALYAELDSRSDFLGKTSQVKTRFISNMTHEFRTPLNSILALAAMLHSRSDGELTVEQVRQVEFIQRSAESLAGLVNDLLDLAKVEAGKVVVKAMPFLVDDLFSTLKGMLRPLLGTGRHVALTFEEVPTGLELDSDEGKISQVLRNFISNALKFTERGEVRVAAAAPSSDLAVFTVTDTGAGIRPEDLPAIFQEFGQVESPIIQRFKGSGLGLPLSKRLAEILGGRVTVASTLGVGSVFTLEIPTAYRGPSQASLIDQGEEATGFKRQALIIDDDDVSRYLLRSLLPATFEVVEASTGAEGLEVVRRLHPDVVFLDLNMPQMSGFEVLDRLKTDAAMRKVPVIVYSAHIMDETTLGRLAKADAILSAAEGDAQTARAATRNALQKVGLIPIGLGDTHA
ncbi:MAG: response regulator [Planctomycetes bacterium]|nr:response regulator [Planctomycetota bacterium]